MKKTILIPMLLLALAACKKDGADTSKEPDTPKQPYIVLKTEKNANTATITLLTDAEPSDRADVWIDLNNNKIKDPGEEVTKFDNFNEYATYELKGSQTITLYGKVTVFGCGKQEISSLDVSKNTALVTLYCDDNKLSSLDLSKNTALLNLLCINNQIAGDHMKQLINSLPANNEEKMALIKENGDGNSLPAQAELQAAKAKNWKLYQLTGIYVELLN